GKVTRVSADAITDDKTGINYFLATIEVEPDQLSRLSNVKLRPGMPVEAAIVIGERTLLDFLTQPITDSFARAFREE
ncbi:MAG: HlyD family type I secretion periplasmic adaptor subunit, partial [Methyloceanibacter sp.]